VARSAFTDGALPAGGALLSLPVDPASLFTPLPSLLAVVLTARDDARAEAVSAPLPSRAHRSSCSRLLACGFGRKKREGRGRV